MKKKIVGRLLGICFAAYIEKLIILMQQPKVFIPAEHVSKILEMSKDVFSNEEELGFVKSCLYYLMEGVSAEYAIDMAMIDYLIDL